MQGRIQARGLAKEATEEEKSDEENKDFLPKVTNLRYFLCCHSLRSKVPKMTAFSGTMHSDQTVGQVVAAWKTARENNDPEDISCAYVLEDNEVYVQDDGVLNQSFNMGLGPQSSGNESNDSAAKNKSKVHEKPPKKSDFESEKDYIKEIKEYWLPLAKKAAAEDEVLYHLRQSIEDKSALDYCQGVNDLDKFVIRYQEYLFPNKIQRCVNALESLFGTESLEQAAEPKIWFNNLNKARRECADVDIIFEDKTFGVISLFLARVTEDTAINAALQTKQSPTDYQTVKNVLEGAYNKASSSGSGGNILAVARAGGRPPPKLCHYCRENGFEAASKTHFTRDCRQKEADRKKRDAEKRKKEEEAKKNGGKGGGKRK